MNKRKINRIIGVFWLVIGALICLESYRVSLGSIREPGQGFFPFLTGLAIFVLAIASIIGTRKIAIKEKIIIWTEHSQIIKVTLGLLSIFAYGLFLDSLGFFFVTLLYVGFQEKFIAGEKWSKVAILSILSSLGFYVIFQIFLKSELPRGFLEFWE
jgi:putative tricarboxylic transport membrane protein